MADMPVEEEVRPDVVNGGRIYSALIPLVLAIAGAAVALNGVSLGVGTAEQPGPGMWPLGIGIIWTLAALGLAYSGWVGKLRLEALVQLRRPGTGLVLAVLFVALFSYVGFISAIVVTLVLWSRLLAGFTWRRTAWVTAVITALLYVLFAVVVGTAFPSSLIGLG
ncbi:tripartite tricarboxylate transporter TctB family protein [Arthrobacter nitrophenolicus]|uniref:Tripartite tricarboxylate transporter TctB family protein n=1 Tax=Arthrobacter nitrophenolicus TaxID=683150 RepID=A0A4R5Y8L0_9MICC|nr:tripartite tricarboxylate transporter TctB family protein [Arthrobacter nitrophenolicus]TDL39655.1 tripartite tricarboxylate transporter TctB family protein [Arthrobacter nitrophenolicus]